MKVRYILFFLLLASPFLTGFGESLTAQTLDIEISGKGGYAEKKLAKGPKRAYIHRFEAYFQTLAFGAASSRARSFRNTKVGATRTEMLIALDGVQAADLQAATDEAYQALVADLEAQGYEIIDAATAQAQSELLSEWTLLEGGKLSSAQLEGFARATPSGYSYLVPKVKKGGKEKSTFIAKDPKISGQLDDALVVSVSFVFPFAEIGAASTFLPGRSKVKAKTDFRLASAVTSTSQERNILGEQKAGGSALTQVTFTSGKGAGAMARAYMLNSLKKDLALPGVVEVASFKEATAADVTDAGAYAWYQTIELDDIDTKATHVISTDSQKYRSAVTEAMRALTEGSLARLRAGK